LDTLKKNEYATKSLFFACGIGFASWASRLPEIKEKLMLNDAELGSVLFAMPIGSFLALPFAAFLIDKISSRKTIIFACLLYLFALPSLGYANEIWQLVIALFVFGFAGDTLNISMNVQAVGVEKLQKRSIMNQFHAIFSVGFMVGAALGGFLSKVGVIPFIHLGVIALIVICLGFFSYNILIEIDEKPEEKSPLFALPDKSLIIFGIICFCGMLAEGAMADWSVIYYKQILNNPNGFVTAAFTAFSISMVFGRFWGDFTVAKIGLTKTLYINAILLILGMAVALIVHTPIAAIIGFSIAGLGLSTMVPLGYSEAGHSKTMSSGSALAAITTVGMIGFLLGPVLIGYISQYSTLRIALSLLILLGFLAIYFISKIKIAESTNF
jgi:MFS family permease